MAQSAQIQKVSGWHERLADWLILNPTKSQAEAAKEFGVTQAWLSVIINSDAFRDHFSKKSTAHSEALLASVREKTMGLADQVVSQLQEKVMLTGAVMTTQELVMIGDMALKRSGHGEPRAASGPPVQVNIGLVTRDELREARERMRAPRALQSPAGHEGEGSNIIELHPNAQPGEA